MLKDPAALTTRPQTTATAPPLGKMIPSLREDGFNIKRRARRRSERTKRSWLQREERN